MAPNFRELAGFSTADGRRIRPGLLFRSGAFYAADTDSLAHFSARGIRTCVDLRSAGERVKNPIPWPQAPRPQVLELAVDTDIRALGPEAFSGLLHDEDGSGAVALMQSLYRLLPHTCAPVLRNIFAQIVDRDDALPLMINCTAGKDRTGFTVSMLLSAIGIAEPQIRADYMRSTDLVNRPELRAKVESLVQNFVGVVPGPRAIRALTGVSESYLDAALTQIKTDFGSVDAYLRECVGLESSAHARLRERWLQ